MRQRQSDIDALALRVAVVTFEAGAVAQAYIQETRLTWPLLVDDTRALYRAYDMLKAGAWDLWGPRSWWAYLKLIARGRRPRIPRADPAQRGGDVLIDPQGIVCFHHAGAGPWDRPPVDTLLAAVRGPQLKE